MTSIGIILESERRTGQTTRLIDSMVQDLFTTGKCKIRDHDEECHNETLNRHLRKRVLSFLLRRLEFEHAGHTFKVDRKNWIVELDTTHLPQH